MVFLRQQIREFIEHSKRENIYMAEWSEATMWGGTSLLQMHLRAFKELLEMKRDNSKWNWDYVINLSESDFPIKFVVFFLLFSKDLKHRLIKTQQSCLDLFRILRCIWTNTVGKHFSAFTKAITKSKHTFCFFIF